MLKKLKKNKKGFTLAELLIVVAIIAVLVAISIPIFTSQRKKAYLATNQANARSAYAVVTSTYLTDGLEAGQYKYDVAEGTLSTTKETATVTGDVTTTDAPAKWVVGTPTGIDTKTYDAWYVTIDANGKVTHYDGK